MTMLSDLLAGLATPSPAAAGVAKPASVAATPAGATADPNTWPDDWWPNPSNAETWPDDWWPQAPAPAPGGFGPGATGPLSGFAPPSGGYGYGPGAAGALSGFDPTGGRSGPTQDELAAMVSGLQAEQEYSWYNPMGWIDAIPGVQNEPGEGDPFGDFFGEGGTARNFLSGVEDGARWLADPSYQAIQELLQGDLSGAIGDFAGGTANQLAPAAGYLAQEGLDVLGNLGDNIYNNWGLRSGLNQLGADITGIPGQVGNLSMDALRYLGNQAGNLGQAALGQAGEWGQAGLGQLGDLQDYLRAQGENVAKWGGNQLLNLGSEVGDFVSQQAIPYFQQDFVGDVQNLYGGVKEWAVDDAWGEAIQPFYENVLKPAGIDIADFAVEDVYRDIVTPLYENYLKPAGLDIADFTSQEAWPYIRDNLRHDISNVLESVPAFVRGVAPEGSRVDDWLEAGVGGIGSAYNWAEGVPGQVGEFGGRVTDYLFDPSKPAWSQGGGGQDADAQLQAVIEQIIASGGGAGGAASGVAAPGTGANVAGGPMAYPGAGGFGGDVAADPLGAGLGGGAPSTLDDLYSTLYGDMRTAAGEMYDVGAAGAMASGELGRAYADEIKAQGAAAASAAEAAAQQYYSTGTDEAARAYNETIGALNSREQQLLTKYTELETMQAGGISGDASEQRRVTEEISGLQQARNDLRHQMVSGQLTAEGLRGAGRLSEFGATRGAQLAADEAGLIQQLGAMETGRVGQEAAMAEQLATRFSGARAGMQGRIDAAEATLRAKGIEPAAYTAAPGAEAQALLTSQELSMETLQNRLRDASAAQAIDRQMRGREIYSAAGRALEDNLFSMRSQLEESIATRRDMAALDKFDAQADTDIAKAAALGEINLEEMTRLQASKEGIFGKRTDLFDQGELAKITTRNEYNAALERERGEQRRSMERAQEQRIIADAAAAQQSWQSSENEMTRLNDLEIARIAAEGDVDTAENMNAIDALASRLSEEQRLAEEFMTVTVNGIDIPVDRDWYTKKHMIGDGAGADLSSDVNLMQMQDSAGNSFYVDVGGVSEEGLPYLTQSAATNPMLTGDVLTTVFGDAASLVRAADLESRASESATLDNLDQFLPAEEAAAWHSFLDTLG